jgi:hypothetical protein
VAQLATVDLGLLRPLGAAVYWGLVGLVAATYLGSALWLRWGFAMLQLDGRIDRGESSLVLFGVLGMAIAILMLGSQEVGADPSGPAWAIVASVAPLAFAAVMLGITCRARPPGSVRGLLVLNAQPDALPSRACRRLAERWGQQGPVVELIPSWRLNPANAGRLRHFRLLAIAVRLGRTADLLIRSDSDLRRHLTQVPQPRGLGDRFKTRECYADRERYAAAAQGLAHPSGAVLLDLTAIARERQLAQDLEPILLAARSIPKGFLFLYCEGPNWLGRLSQRRPYRARSEATDRLVLGLPDRVFNSYREIERALVAQMDTCRDRKRTPLA